MNSHTNQTIQKPNISVIIPFKDNFEELMLMVAEIFRQNYPSDKIEVICIDNGSAVRVELAGVGPAGKKVIILSEANYPNSPYSARNRGVEKSSGEILVFADANSKPGPNWLEAGIACMQKTGADIAAGRVNFDFGNQLTGAKIVDSITSIDQKRAVTERGVAYTANVFIRKHLFDTTGYFEEGARSGGDVRWTTRAVNKGYKIIYCDDAVVYKYARGFRGLLKKRIRTGRGYYYTWKKEENRRAWYYNFLRALKPPSLKALTARYQHRYGEPLTGHVLGVWFVYYLANVTEQLSFIKEYFNHRF